MRLDKRESSNLSSNNEINSIPVPTFRKAPCPLKSQVKHRRSTRNHRRNKRLPENEKMDDESAYRRHRPLENAEKRERKREEDLMQYEEYIIRLRRDYPALFR